MTNYEKIKTMSVEEMVRMFRKFICRCGYCPALEICKKNIDDKGFHCSRSVQEWLESEVEEDG